MDTRANWIKSKLIFDFKTETKTTKHVASDQADRVKHYVGPDLLYSYTDGDHQDRIAH